MTRQEYDLMLESIQATYHCKPFTKNAMDRWFEKVRDISSRHCVEITRRIEDLDRMPANLGKSIFDAASVLEPEQGEEAGKWVNECPECDPGRWKGQIVYFTKLTDGRIAKHLADCANCRPSSINKATRAGLAAIGVHVPPTPADVPVWYFRMFRANNLALAEKVEAQLPLLDAMAQAMMGKNPRRHMELLTNESRTAA